MIGTILLGLVLFFGMGALCPSEGHAQFHSAETCPVMPGNRANKKFFVDHEGRRIYLCCRACVKAFKRNPEKYLKPTEGH